MPRKKKVPDTYIDQRDEPTHIMARTEAAVGWITRVNGATKAQELDAFMSIFHPDKFKDRKYMRELHQAADTYGKRAGT